MSYLVLKLGEKGTSQMILNRWTLKFNSGILAKRFQRNTLHYDLIISRTLIALQGLIWLIIMIESAIRDSEIAVRVGANSGVIVALLLVFTALTFHKKSEKLSRGLVFMVDKMILGMD